MFAQVAKKVEKENGRRCLIFTGGPRECEGVEGESQSANIFPRGTCEVLRQHCHLTMEATLTR